MKHSSSLAIWLGLGAAFLGLLTTFFLCGLPGAKRLPMLQLSLLPRNLNSTYATARPTPTKSEHLQTQFATKDALLTSKEETLALLHISFNRPN